MKYKYILNGWEFERDSKGSIVISHVIEHDERIIILDEIIIDPEIWLAIIAALEVKQ